jgi:hypothetical protein
MTACTQPDTRVAWFRDFQLQSVLDDIHHTTRMGATVVVVVLAASRPNLDVRLSAHHDPVDLLEL